LIFEGLPSRNSHLLVKAFTTYAGPLVEYNTYFSRLMVYAVLLKFKMFRVRFTKRIPSESYSSYLPYRDRLEWLGLESLEYRRLIAASFYDV
jgi:hypothetical protein